MKEKLLKSFSQYPGEIGFALASGCRQVIFFTFRASRLANATYNWKLPSGATLVSGQNSPEVVINWGKKPGKVRVKVQHKGETYSKAMSVKTKPVFGNVSAL
ncbi:hypothetical protein [Rufibacter aurantiacus]|uniref:hypothetical protein n=1 Tax=Rufibacter aurantiacus TaxID=2817374 RepID=UPI001B30DC99|nr:hypothetical protein [Rufibacter aurantiacus]